MTRKLAAITATLLTGIIVMLTLCQFSVPSCFTTGKKDILVILRYDDFSSRSNTELELNIIRALRERHMSCTFAVIPYVCERNYLDTGRQGFMVLNPGKAAILKEALKAGTLEVALHGYTHQTVRTLENGCYSEFSGLDYQSQEMKIGQGKKLLEGMLGVGIATFVPPFNSYDANTLRVLEKLDFRFLSANSFGESAGPSRLKYLPVTCELPQLRAIVAAAENMSDEQPVISVMFHEYDFIEAGGKRGKFSFEEFSRTLNWLASHKDIRVMTVGQAADQTSDLSSRRYADNKAYCGAYTLIPAFIGRPEGVYLTSNAAVVAKNRLWALVTAFYFAIFCAAGFAAFWGGSRKFVGPWLLGSCIGFAVAAFLFLTAAYALHLKSPGYRGSLLMAALLGGCIGASAAYVRSGNKTGRCERGKTTGSGRSGHRGQESA